MKGPGCRAAEKIKTVSVGHLIVLVRSWLVEANNALYPGILNPHLHNPTSDSQYFMSWHLTSCPTGVFLIPGLTGSQGYIHHPVEGLWGTVGDLPPATEKGNFMHSQLSESQRLETSVSRWLTQLTNIVPVNLSFVCQGSGRGGGGGWMGRGPYPVPPSPPVCCTLTCPRLAWQLRKPSFFSCSFVVGENFISWVEG